MKKILVSRNSLYRYNLYDELEKFSDYEEFIKDLAMYGENDNIALYINSPGGRVDIGVSLVSAIKNALPKVTAIVEGPSYSMASIIALACDNLIMLDNTFLMFHNYSSAVSGKGSEIKDSVHHNDAHFINVMASVCHPFLTQLELDRINKDQDIYIYSDDKTLTKRKLRHFK